MIRLDQIKVLESKVNKAVEQIRLLREENKALKRTIEKSQARMGELEGLVSRFKTDQEEIEQGILRALKNLDKLEDEVGTKASRKEAAPQSADNAEPQVPPRAPAREPVREPTPVSEPAEEPVVDTGDGVDGSAEQLDFF